MKYEVFHEYVNIWVILERLILSIHNSVSFFLSLQKNMFKGSTLIMSFDSWVCVYTETETEREPSIHQDKCSDASLSPSYSSPLQHLTRVDTSPHSWNNCLHPFVALCTLDTGHCFSVSSPLLLMTSKFWNAPGPNLHYPQIDLIQTQLQMKLTVPKCTLPVQLLL